MNGKINKVGVLVIERNGVPVPQICPYSHSNAVACGHWCPLFGEPEKPERSDTIINVWLQICEQVLQFKNFNDERGKND